MRCAKVMISIEERLLRRIDRLVGEGMFSSRSQAIQVSIVEKLDRLESGRLARVCARLEPRSEQAMADEGLDEDLEQWPEY